MTEPIEDPAQLFAELTVWEFAEIKRHLGEAWPPGHFEVDITINPETGRLSYGVIDHVYYLLEGMCARAKRSETRSVVELWCEGRPVAHRIVSPEGKFIASHESAGNN